MKAKQIWANLATNDLERTTKFYTELGFKVNNSYAMVRVPTNQRICKPYRN